MTGQLSSPGTCTPVSSTNKTDLHDITEILLKVALNTINPVQSNLITERTTSKTDEKIYRVRIMVLKATFNKISIISCGQFYWWKKPNPDQKNFSMRIRNFIFRG